MKICNNCKEDNYFLSESEKTDICNSFMEYRPSELQKSFPKNSDIEMTIEDKRLKEGCKIFYWAAESIPLIRANKIKSQKDAYNDSNWGLTRVKKNNTASFKICAPQCYKENKILWPKHIHFIIQKNKEDQWEDNMYTLLCLPVETQYLKSKKLKNSNIYVTPMQIKKNWKDSKFYMVYAEKETLPTLKDLKEYKTFNHLHIPWESQEIKIPQKVKKETPLVIYGLDEKSKSGKKLILRLAKMGYENLFLMDLGIKNFSTSSKKLFV